MKRSDVTIWSSRNRVVIQVSGQHALVLDRPTAQQLRDGLATILPRANDDLYPPRNNERN